MQFRQLHTYSPYNNNQTLGWAKIRRANKQDISCKSLLKVANLYSDDSLNLWKLASSRRIKWKKTGLDWFILDFWYFGTGWRTCFFARKTKNVEKGRGIHTLKWLSESHSWHVKSMTEQIEQKERTCKIERSIFLESLVQKVKNNNKQLTYYRQNTR